MALVSGKIILQHARDNNYAVPAFGFVNLEGALGIIKAAEEANSPVILQTTGGGINYAGHNVMACIGKTLAQNANVPVALHLDHGKELLLVDTSVQLGYTSVMYDGSELSVEQNILNSLKAKQLIGDSNVSLEVEIGLISGKEDDMEHEVSNELSAEEIIDFAKKIKPTSLAFPIGTAHGKYRGEPKLNQNLIKEIHSKIPEISLVMHGGSWVPDKDVMEAVKNGITKANFDSELKNVFITKILEFMDTNNDEYDIRKIFTPSINAQKDICLKKMKICFSENKNWLK